VYGWSPRQSNLTFPCLDANDPDYVRAKAHPDATVDLITLAIGRLQRMYDSPQTSSHHSEAKIALADLKMALYVLTEPSNKNHRQVLPDLRLLVHRLEGIDEPNISEAHDDILEACLLVEYV
jgi:hypothetical protein